MFIRLTTGLVSCLLLSSFIGCAQSPGLVRGQDPQVYADNSINPQDPGTWVHSNNGMPFPYNNRLADQMQAQTNRGLPGYCPDCYRNGEAPHWNGSEWCYNDGTVYNGWAPTHTYQHQYKVPRNLVYPEANAPGGVMVYPYYTHKGPDDFFAK